VTDIIATMASDDRGAAYHVADIPAGTRRGFWVEHPYRDSLQAVMSQSGRESTQCDLDIAHDATRRDRYAFVLYSEWDPNGQLVLAASTSLDWAKKPIHTSAEGHVLILARDIPEGCWRSRTFWTLFDMPTVEIAERVVADYVKSGGYTLIEHSESSALCNSTAACVVPAGAWADRTRHETLRVFRRDFGMNIASAPQLTLAHSERLRELQAAAREKERVQVVCDNDDEWVPNA
jgi:hypothetical protein